MAPMATVKGWKDWATMVDMTSRSGTSRSYAERKKKGRPNATFSLSEQTVDDITELAERIGISRSAVVSLAVEELKKKKK